MDVGRMVIEFKIGVDKIDSYNSSLLLPEEIDTFLQNAYEEFIETRMSGFNEHRTGLEQTQKRMDDLKGLMSTYSTSTFSTGSLNNSKFVSLPDDYRHAVQESVLIECTNELTRGSKEVEVIPIDHGKYNRLMKNPFTAANEKRVLRLSYQDKHELIYKDITPATYRMRYIREPLKIDSAQVRTPLGLTSGQTIELDESTHREIVAIAVSNALEAIMSPRFQSKLVLNKTIE